MLIAGVSEFLQKMPAVKGDGMRGLAVFISDIRNCKLQTTNFGFNVTELLRKKYVCK